MRAADGLCIQAPAVNTSAFVPLVCLCAMAVEFPDFSDPLLDRVSFCTYLTDESLLRRYSGAPAIEWDAKYGDDHWCHLLIDDSKRANSDLPVLHFHVDAVRAFGPGKAPPNHDVEDILSELDAFVGLTAKSHVAVWFAIPKERRPKRGIVPAMAGIAVESDGYTLTLTGARMSISGGDFDQIEWREEEDGKLTVVLDAVLEVQIGDRFLLSATEFIREGLDRFLLGSSEAVHANQE